MDSEHTIPHNYYFYYTSMMLFFVNCYMEMSTFFKAFVSMKKIRQVWNNMRVNKYYF